MAQKDKRILFYEKMNEGAALNELIYNDKGRAIDYTILDVNPAFSELTGISRDDAIGSRASKLYNVGEAPYIDHFAKVVGQKRSDYFETFFAPLESYLAVSAFPAEQDQFATLFMDINQRRRSEERINHLNAVLKSLRSIKDLMLHEHNMDQLLKLATNILIKQRGYFSAWIARLNETGQAQQIYESGLPETFRQLYLNIRNGDFPGCMHQALGPSQIALITKPDVICHGCPLSRIYQDKGVITLPLIYEKQTLGVLSVSLPASFLFDQQEITLLKEIAADLAYAMETIQQEQQVQAQEIKYREIFDNVNDAIFLHRVLQEGTSQFVEVNQLACDRLGYSKEELLELSPKDINTPEGLNKIPEVINILKQGKKHTFTTEHLAKDGKRIPVEISSKLFELEGQTLILSVARDLSQRTKPD